MQSNTETATTDAAERSLQEVNKARMPEHGYLPYVTSDGRISLAPQVAWADLGKVFGQQDRAQELRELQDKATVLRQVAADFIRQAEALEADIAQG